RPRTCSASGRFACRAGRARAHAQAVILSARRLLALLVVALLAGCGGTGAQGPAGPRGATGPSAVGAVGEAGPIGPPGVGIALVAPAIPYLRPLPPRLLPSPPPVRLLPPGPPPPAVERIRDPAIGLNALVAGVSLDCTGRAVLPSDGAYVDACESAVRYLVGHDTLAIFQPLHRLHLGDVIGDGASRLRVIELRDRWPAGGFPPIPPGTVDMLQTCDDDSPAYDLIVSLGGA